MRFGGFGFNKQFGFSAPSSPIPAGGGELGPELWPQPLFDAGTGITLDGGGGTTPTISGGVLTFFDDGDPASASATSAASLTAGMYRYEINVTALSGSINIDAGGGATDINTTGNHGGEFEAFGGFGDTISLLAGFASATITSFSLKKVL